MSSVEATREIVAEFSAQVISLLVLKKMPETLGNSYAYIKKYADQEGKEMGRFCYSLLSEIEKVIKKILE